MWSSPHNNDTISLSEAYEVAWCTKFGHGTRVIPSGAITGAQLLYAKNYIQLVGYIDQQEINLWSGDEGGELDPHGFDKQGNPLGGLVFTNGFDMNAASFDALVTSNGTPSTNYTQVEEWVNFVGNGIFCMKICNPAGPDAPTLCAHTYDEIGCDYNAPADYGSINGTYQVCDSDDMTPPGVFVTAGTTTTWVQPWSGSWTVPYTASIPQSSNCKTYSSEQLFATALPAGQGSSTTTTATSGTATATATNSGGAAGSSNKGSASPSRTGSSTSTSNTSTSSSAASRGSSGPSNSLFVALSTIGAAAFVVPLFFI